MLKRMCISLMVVVVLASMLTACGGGAPAPVTLGDLPVFTGATETTNQTLIDALNTSVENAKAGGQVKNVSGKVYELPADTTWDAVNSFYKPALEKAGWTVARSEANILAFARGQQAFVINFAPGPVLVAVLTEAK